MRRSTTWFAAVVLAAVAGVGTAGCGSKKQCDEGYVESPEGCLPVEDAGAEGGRSDAGEPDGAAPDAEPPCEEFTVYADEDGDGYGDAARAISVCEVPEGYVRDNTDCDDGEVSVHPGADEYCNDVDDDCDGETDEAGASDVRTFYRDADGDGYGDAADTVEDCAPPEGYVADATDCNDDPMAGGADVNPGASEACNEVDDDCDGETDEDFSELGTACTVGIGACEASGTTVCAADGSGTTCDATPGMPSAETCNGVDDDCDGETDEDFSDLGTACTVGTGACEASGTMVCVADGSGTTCDATPGTPSAETCNGVDDDCDGETDEPEATDATVYYADCDGDGYLATDARRRRSCTMPPARPSGCADGQWLTDAPTADTADCDDSSATVHPGADEYCNSVDDDCDGSTDERGVVDGTVYYRDKDDDGYGMDGTARRYCAPRGWWRATVAGDCDDDVNTTYPGADEYCNSVDDDCDGTTDEPDALDARVYYADCDRDGYAPAGAETLRLCGTPVVAPTSCPGGQWIRRVPRGRNIDCNDGAPNINRDAPELCNGVDDDCDGSTDEDFTTLGDACTVGVGACQRTGNLVCDAAGTGVTCDATPGMPSPEICDYVDNDCDGQTDEPGASGERSYYVDCDRDGYAPSVAGSVYQCWAPSTPPAACGAGGGWTTRSPSSASNRDCYDGNADANPAAMSFWSTDRGDLSFDYNCNTIEEKRWVERQKAACEDLFTTRAACDANPYLIIWWGNAPPACGARLDNDPDVTVVVCSWDSATGTCVTKPVPAGDVVYQECR